MLRKSIFIASVSMLALSGCAKDDTLRTEGLTLGAGDAVATNSALQIIDPWPAGVEDTDINAPADRTGPEGAKETVAAPGTTGGGQP